MNITVIGLGYVGLVTSACLAEWGHDVTGVEVNPERLTALQRGSLPFFEPGLDEMVTRHRQDGRLAFTASAPDSVSHADIVMVAVGTHDGNGGWQTETMLACLSQVVPFMHDQATLVLRSTLPPDFIRQLPRLLRSLRDQAGRGPISALVNPEFTREGVAVHDFLEAERVVLGVIDDPDRHGVERLTSLYAVADAPILTMDAIDAAFAKLGSNLFLATKISFANELAALCDAYGARVQNVVEAMSYDSRIGGRFLRAGVGFGGSCLPHQVTMTVKAAALASIPAPLLAAVDEINHRQRADFVKLMEALVDGSVDGLRVALLGLTFKPDTDDLRDAPALDIARFLIAAGAEVVAYDPMETARKRSEQTVPGLQTVDSVEAAVAGADALGIVTEWTEFRSLDWATLATSMRGRAVVDGRGVLDPAELNAAGFDYAAFGHGVHLAADGPAAGVTAAASTALDGTRVLSGAPVQPESAGGMSAYRRGVE